MEKGQAEPEMVKAVVDGMVANWEEETEGEGMMVVEALEVGRPEMAGTGMEAVGMEAVVKVAAASVAVDEAAAMVVEVGLADS